MVNQPGPGLSFLERLRPETTEALFARGSVRTYAVGQVAMHEGEWSREVLLIRRGWFDIVKGNVDGREMVIAQRGVGELVGELSAIDALPRTASVRAATEGEVVVVPSRDFRELVEGDGELARALLAHLAARVRQASGGLLEFGVVDGTSRVCSNLVALLDRDRASPDTGVGPTRVAIGSQERFGQVVGLHRSTLVKILGDLRRLGVIETGRGTVTIVDQRRLRKLASDTSAG